MKNIAPTRSRASGCRRVSGDSPSTEVMNDHRPLATSWLVTGWATLGYAVNSMNQQVTFLVGEQIKFDLRLNDTQLGILFGLSYMAFSALSALPLGRLADIFRRRLVVGLSLGLMSAASALTSLSNSFVSLIGLRALAGVGDGGMVPAGTAMIGASVPMNRRTLSLSIFTTGSALGTFICYRYGSLIAEAHGWRALYSTVGVLGLIVAVAIATLTPDRVGHIDTQAPRERLSVTVTALARIPAYRQIVLAFIATGFVYAASWNWISLVLQRGYGLSVQSVGAFLSLGFGIATVAGSLAYGLIAWRLRQRRRSGPILAAIAMQIASAACFLTALTSESPLFAEVGLFMALFLAGACTVVVFDTIQDILPDHQRATGVGLAMLLFSLLGQSLGPLFTGFLSDLVSPTLGAASLTFVVRWVMGIGCAWIVLHLLLAARAVDLRHNSATNE